MTERSILNQLGLYFGGPYDAARRIYATPGAPIVPGLYAVRRSRPTQQDEAQYLYGAPSGTLSGALMTVQVANGMEHRIAVAGATSGMKQVEHALSLHVYIRSSEPFAEDVTDFGYDLKDAIFARIRADRTCGSGGLENGANGGFQIGEGGEPWLRWGMSMPEVKVGLTKIYLRIECEAHEYIFA